MTLIPSPPLAADSPLHRFDVWAAEAAHAADELLAEGNLDAAAVWFSQAQHLRRTIADLERHLEGVVAALMPAKKVQHDTLGMLERRTGTDRKAWDWESLTPALTRAALVKHDGSLSDAMAEVLEVVGLTPSRGPRVRPLRDLGLDPDDYCESSPGRVSVQIHTPEAAKKAELREATYEHVESVNDGPAQEWGEVRPLAPGEDPF